MDHLPVFLNLRDRLTLVVGGGSVAARKVELLLQAYARVRVVAPQLHPELALHSAAGRIEYVNAAFQSAHFDGVQFAIAATDQVDVNRAVAAAGAQRNIFVNVVDDSVASSCIMPSIVDRSPLIVAIGTSGASPTLARRVRAQIEALLPGRLGELVSWAGRARERVQQALPDIDQRRRFWDRLLTGRVATQALAGDMRQVETLFESELQTVHGGVSPSGGEVYLIGTGPGDPDLLTLRALQLMQQADVVLYDRLVSAAILQRVRRDAERVFVGKQPGQIRVEQQDIHSMLCQYAQRGLRVARLKGGDPFIFGRGGEELQALTRAGIPVVVVPGITAALGAAAATGLPLTLRGVAQSVTFVTATGEAAESLDWRSLAAPMQTVVFYMGVAQLQQIVIQLRAHGASARLPAALIERATLPEQRTVTGTLSDIAQRAQQMQVAAPALLIVGEVVAHLSGGERGHTGESVMAMGTINL